MDAAVTPDHPHRWLVRVLLAAATVLAIIAIASVWAARQVLNAENWSNTSTQLLEDPAIRSQVAAYLVDEVYANVDVAGELRAGLPPALAPLAGPAAGGLRNLALQTADRALARPRVQDAWRAANRATAEQLIAIAEGDSRAVTTSGNAVVLDLRVVLLDVVNRLGLSGRLAGRLPTGAGRIKILSSSQVSTLQDGASLLRWCGRLLPVLALALFGLAVYLARGRRRRTLMLAGGGLIGAGIVVLVARNIGQDQVVASLATTDAVAPAVGNAYAIATHMLRDIAQAAIVIGIPLVLAGWLAGPAGLAVGFRRAAAPSLRDRPDLTYLVVAIIVGLVLVWGPIPATRMILPVLVMIALVIAGVEALRRQTAEEFPDATAAAPGARVSQAAGLLRRERPNGNGSSTSRAPHRIEQLERLAALYEAGRLTDEEYAAEKAAIAGTSAQPV